MDNKKEARGLVKEGGKGRRRGVFEVLSLDVN